MNRAKLKKIVNDPKMVPGIYNYCDRWCERCNMTSKCSTYALEQSELANDEKDGENEVFWEKVSDMFKLVKEIILEDAERLGIDLDSEDWDNTLEEDKDFHEKIDQHPLALSSTNYIEDVGTWFTKAEDVLTKKEEELIKSQELGIKNNEGQDLKDSLEMISWYKFQIHVKIKRGLHGKLDEMLPEDESYPKDSDGSVKVALIGIDRSLAGWGKLLASFPDEEDEILKILVRLEKLRRNVEQEFPDAKAFIRPGFDD